MTYLSRNGVTALLVLAACGPVADSGDASDSSADHDDAGTSAGDTTAASMDPGSGGGTDAQEPDPTEAGDVSTAGDEGTTTASMTTGEPDAPTCWQFELAVDSPGRTPAMGLAVAAGHLLLGGTPTTSGLARVGGGEVTWEKSETVPGAGLFVTEVAPVGDGVFAFGTISSDDHETGRALWMGRLDGDGEPIWTRELGPAHSNVWAHVDARVHPAGGFFVSTDDGVPGGEQALRLLHIDDAGETVWATQYPLQPDLDIAINWSLGAMDVLADGGVVQITAAPDAVRVIRTDDAGALVWEMSLADIGWPRDVVALADGGFAVLTSTVDADFLVRIDGDGESVGASKYQQGPDSNATALAHDPATDTFLIAGGTRGVDGPDASLERTWLIVADSDGDAKWVHVGEAGTPSHTYEVRVTGPGAYALSAHGEQLWVATVTTCDPV